MEKLVVSEHKKADIEFASEIERLLRSLGVTGRLIGFGYLVYIVANELQQTYSRRFLTKCIYPETAKFFAVTPSSVERGVRTVVKTCWKRCDHTALDKIAGIHLEAIPTNSEFIDMLTAYMRFYCS